MHAGQSNHLPLGQRRQVLLQTPNSRVPTRPTDEPTTAEHAGGDRPRRQKSLVRPERERIGANHRQYHYRQRATENIAPSTTGNQPGHPLASNSIRRRPTTRQTLLRRGKSILGREDRLTDDDGMEPPAAISDNNTSPTCLPNPWLTYCRLLTCCFPNPVLTLMGIPEGPAQLAWREKIGLVSMILFIMGFVGFLTFGFTQAVCPAPPFSVQGGQVGHGYLIIHGWAYMLAAWSGHPAVPGLFNASSNVLYSSVEAGGMDASFLFQDPVPHCTNVFSPTPDAPPVYFPCRLFNPNQTMPPDPATLTNTTGCHLTPTARSLYTDFTLRGVPKSTGGFDKAARVYYDWDNITKTDHLMVYNGDVLNLRLLASLPGNFFRVRAGGLVDSIMRNMTMFGGQDMTHAIASYRNKSAQWVEEAECLASTIKVGSLDTVSLGCMASDIVLYLSLVVILGVIITKFLLAVIFGWFLSWQLGNFREGQSYAARMKREAEIEHWSKNIHTMGPTAINSPPPIKRKSFFPQTSRYTQPMPGSMRFDAEKLPLPTWKSNASVSGNGSTRAVTSPFTERSMSFNKSLSPSTPRPSGGIPSSRCMSVASSSDNYSGESHQDPHCPFPMSPHVLRQPATTYMPFNFPLVHTICLVTCYSEGEEGVRTTLDSIATSDYPNTHKLILVVCDGIITGHGNGRSTPDICVSMMQDFIIPADQVEPSSYIAIADGAKRNNMAKVYSGFYKYDDATVEPGSQQRVPMVTIVKCGTPEEANESKPGNRGKRDSQIILMQFMQRVMFDERMTTLDYQFFNGIWRVAGIPPDRYEIVLMVDADTKLYTDALSRLISCAVRDPEISGLCGETKIANKTDSWVAMIQVFEYYISHHQSKAFESIFGGVTCLPGCFCMYRIKAPKGPNGFWVPILANPDIVEHYSENVVDTLHKKNLLLLGEDRYLSTLMLRTFPNRKMLFVPQAVCKTVVPDTFKVLLSQRRRWINSTIHNLMELLFVHDLCGTFCFSMQFVVFMELVGTLALPAAISFTLYLIVMAFLGQPAVIPLILLALILGLPAVLIVMTSRKVIYVGWMIVYLFSLPIWNFVLPTYAYWHFDDFSWGDTRKVEGGEKETGHGDKEGEFDSSRIVMKKWSDYEKDRRIRQAKERNLPVPRFSHRRGSVDNGGGHYHHRLKNSGSGGSTETVATPLQKPPLIGSMFRPAPPPKDYLSKSTRQDFYSHTTKPLPPTVKSDKIPLEAITLSDSSYREISFSSPGSKYNLAAQTRPTIHGT